MLKQNPDPDLTVFVVWQPMRGGKETHVPEATRLVPDRRATHWWDEDGATLTAFQSATGLDGDVWDAYLVYPPGTRWEGDAAPKPVYWEHQLQRAAGLAPFLDGETLASKVLAITAAASNANANATTTASP